MLLKSFSDKTKLRETPKDVGYQAVSESLQWLRTKISDTVKMPHMSPLIIKVDEMDNPQPSS